MDVTIAVATFGEQAWIDLAHERAIPSAAKQAPVVHVHGETLHDARNAALDLVETEWVIYLDADDELEPGYVEAMAAGSGDLRAPAVGYVHNGHQEQVAFPHVAGHRHDCTGDCLPDGNWLVIGTAARVELVRHVGGWRDFEWCEDWDLWLRCWLAGATVEAVSGAVYRAHVIPGGRNQAPDDADKVAIYHQIRRANLPREYEFTA